MLEEYQNTQLNACRIIINSIKKNRVSHAYIIESNGNRDINKFALAFSKYLFCPWHYVNLDLCKDCKLCQMIDSNNFIELKIIKPNGLWIRKEQLEELQKEFNNKSLFGNKRIYIIQDADRMNIQAANSLLKFLEEPKDNLVAILLVENIFQLLPTIVSRCQILSMNFAKEQNMVENLLEKYQIADKEDIEKKVDCCVKFIMSIESNNSVDIMLLSKKILDNFKEKNEMLMFFDIITFLYQEIMTFYLNGNIKIFRDYQDDVKKIVNSKEKISKKISIIMDLSTKIKINANQSLLLDKLVVSLERVNAE
ncbi:MAG: hypothetical protein PHD02_02835 [Bacilli bacterium]|nr:hypothetical protein [Bacilli bacterium]